APSCGRSQDRARSGDVMGHSSRGDGQAEVELDENSLPTEEKSVIEALFRIVSAVPLNLSGSGLGAAREHICWPIWSRVLFAPPIIDLINIGTVDPIIWMP